MPSAQRLLDMNGYRVAELAVPSAPDDAIRRDYVESRGTGLVTNGSGLMGSNYNFSGFTFDPVETHGGGGSFRTNVAQQSKLSDELIPIDPEKAWRLVGWGKSGDVGGANYNAANKQYFGIAQFDADGFANTYANSTKFAGSTDTTLAVALNINDTTITLTDATGWNNGSVTASRRIGWWPYTNGKGYTWPDYTYTRNMSGTGAWAQGGISGNVITLATPWAGPALPAGTKVRNVGDGGNSGYKYIALGGVAVPNAWTRYEGYLMGANATGTPTTTQFEVGTQYLRLLFLVNYHGLADNNVRWSDLTLTDLSARNMDNPAAFPGSIVLGGDVNLYRYAADVLRTDDSLAVYPGNFAVGTTPVDYIRAYASGIMGDVSGSSVYSIYSGSTYKPVNDNKPFYAHYSYSPIDTSTAVGDLTNGIFAARFLARYNNGARNITNMYGLYAGVDSVAGATGVISAAHGMYLVSGPFNQPVTTYYGLRFGPPSVAGSGSLGTVYGIYMPSFAGLGTTAYAIYTLGGGVRFDGQPALGLGIQPALGRLQFVAGTTPADGIYFGTDTNLYRSAADQLSTDDSLYVAKLMGIATPVADNTQLGVGGTIGDWTAAPATAYGFSVSNLFLPTNKLAVNFYGMDSAPRLDATNATGNFTSFLYGARGLAQYLGGGATARSLANLVGVRGEVQTANAIGSVTNATPIYSAGTVQMPTSNYYGVRINAPTLAGGGTLGTVYGLYIPSHAGIVASGNVYAIYVAGGDSRLDGALGLNTAPGSTAKLFLPGGTTPSDGIAFGTDTNLYRISADKLKTDDAFDVGGILTALAGVNANSQKITSLATPTVASDAATKGYVDGVAGKVNVYEQIAAPASPVIGDIWVDTDDQVVPPVNVPPVVTVLPASPVAGQEVYYMPQIGSYPVWHLRWGGASRWGDGYQWEYLGGPPAQIIDAATRQASWTQNLFGSPYAGDVAFDPPVSGYYRVEFVTSVYPVTAACSTMLGFRINGSVPSTDVDTSGAYHGVASARAVHHLDRVLGPLAAGASGRVNIGYWQNGATQNMQRALASMMVTPVRIATT